MDVQTGDQLAQGRDPEVEPGPPVLVTVPWHQDGAGPVPTADGPVTNRPRKVVVRTVSKAWADSLFGMSSQAAFWCAMSTAPFLLALLGLSGIVTRWFFVNVTAWSAG